MEKKHRHYTILIHQLIHLNMKEITIKYIIFDEIYLKTLSNQKKLIWFIFIRC